MFSFHTKKSRLLSVAILLLIIGAGLAYWKIAYGATMYLHFL